MTQLLAGKRYHVQTDELVMSSAGKSTREENKVKLLESLTKLIAVSIVRARRCLYICASCGMS